MFYTRSSNRVCGSNFTARWSSWYCARVCITKSLDSSITFCKNELTQIWSSATLLCDKKFKNCISSAGSLLKSIFIAHTRTVSDSNWYIKLKQPRVLTLCIASLTSACLRSLDNCAHFATKYWEAAKYSWFITRAFPNNGHLSIATPLN